MYITRFAPTPSGRLHLGSITALVGAYLRARSQGGRFLLRIEDLDFPRCRSEYTAKILKDLDELGIIIDDKVYIQSEHLDFYHHHLREIAKLQESFYCNCTRAELKERKCTCRTQNLAKGALKVILDIPSSFEDNLRGIVANTFETPGILTVKRRDNLISYNLACVLDDALSGITEVVRGADLIITVPLQLGLINLLKLKKPEYFHLPLVLFKNGRKLSKQNHARAALDFLSPCEALIASLKVLGQDLGNVQSCHDPKIILDKAAVRFDPDKIPKNDVIMRQNA